MEARAHRSAPIVSLAVLCLAAGAAWADEGRRPLTAAELDQVTAGAASIAGTEELLTFEAVKKTQSGRTITADGSIELVDSLEGLTIGRLTLNGNAQRNLESMININAVNSAVNVLLNLNVSIDSEVGSINQLNFNDVPMAVPPAAAGTAAR